MPAPTSAFASVPAPARARSLEERLANLRTRIQDEDFLHNRGLGNEVGFYVFQYPAARELQMRAAVARLAADTRLTCNLVVRNLWQVMLGVCASRRILDRVAALEERRGTQKLLERLRSILTAETLVHAMDDWPHTPGRDVLFVTGVGQAYPIVRAHGILECAQPVFPDIPVVLFYPGTYVSSELTLFGRLHDANYYRAFDTL